MTLGEKIKQYRKRMNLTQTEFGNLLGVQKNAVSKWECGRVEDIPSSKIKAMATLFGVRPAFLIDDNDDSNVSESEVFKTVQDTFGESSETCLKLFLSLNKDGQQKVISYMKDISGSFGL